MGDPGININTVNSNVFGIVLNNKTNKIYVADPYHNGVDVGDSIPQFKNIIINSNRPSSIAIDKNIIFVANSLSNSTSIINGSTNKVVGNLTLNNGNGRPYDIAIDSKSNTVYISNFDNGSISVIKITTKPFKPMSIPNIGNHP